MGWIEDQVRNEQAIAQMARQHETLPDEIANLEARRDELLRKKGQLQSRLAHDESFLKFARAFNKNTEAMMGAFLTARRMIDYWYRVADPKILKLRPEAREMMIVLGTLIVAHYMTKPDGAGKAPTREGLLRWNYTRIVRNYRHAFNLLSEGTPAAIVRNYLVRLQENPDADAPVPLKRDLRQGVGMDELGFMNQDAAAEFMALAAAGLKF